MIASVRPVPDGYHTITPSLTCRNAEQAIDFYKKALGAVITVNMPSPDGKVSHAEMKIGDSTIFLNDEMPGMASAPSQTSTPSVYLFLYVPDVDSMFKSAIAAGATVTMPVQDMFWGDRYGKFVDPFGHHWGVATHVEDVSPSEIKTRAAAFYARAAGQS
jgi:PhnB protein